MNLPDKQLDVIDLTKLIREVHYKLQLDYQALMGKTTALEAKNITTAVIIAVPTKHSLINLLILLII